MENIIRKIATGYSVMFPELLERFHENNDYSIVDLVANKVIEKSDKKFINVSELKKEIVDLLNKGL